MDVEHDPSKTAPHIAAEEESIPPWQKWTALAFIVVWLVIIALWHSRIRADVFPLDRSYVAPNLLASFILFSLGLIAGALLWPLMRRRIHRAVEAKLAPLHEHLAVLRQHHEASAARQEHIIRQQAHLIEHSNVPNVTHDGIDLTEHPFTGEKLTAPPGG